MSNANLRLHAALFACLALLTSQTGCTTALKQAYYEVRGAKGDVVLVNNFETQKLLQYQAVEVEPVATTLTPRVCPPELKRAFNRYLGDLPGLISEHYPGGSPKLTGAGEIIYFQPKGLLGPAFFLTRMEFRNDAGEKVIDALVRVESKSFRDGDEEDIAEAGANGLAEFLLKPKKEEAKRQAEEAARRENARD